MGFFRPFLLGFNSPPQTLNPSLNQFVIGHFFAGTMILWRAVATIWCNQYALSWLSSTRNVVLKCRFEACGAPQMSCSPSVGFPPTRARHFQNSVSATPNGDCGLRATCPARSIGRLSPVTVSTRCASVLPVVSFIRLPGFSPKPFSVMCKDPLADPRCGARPKTSTDGDRGDPGPKSPIVLRLKYI